MIDVRLEEKQENLDMMSLLIRLTHKLHKQIPQSRHIPYILIFFPKKLYTLYQGTEKVLDPSPNRKPLRVSTSAFLLGQSLIHLFSSIYAIIALWVCVSSPSLHLIIIAYSIGKT
jgi:hypothetical protein